MKAKKKRRSNRVASDDGLDCLLPGSRALVWDSFMFRNDKETPNLWRPATIIRRYGCKTQFGVYPDCIDVIFDHRPNIESRGHFTDGIRAI